MNCHSKPIESKEWKCDDGWIYLLPVNHCAFCKHCTDVFYDYNGPWLFACNEGHEYDEFACNFFESDERR